VVIGTRQPVGIGHGELFARGEYVRIDADDLRLRVEESIAFLRARFGARLEADLCARLHELAAGWPIALQLVVAVMERDAAIEASAIAASSTDVERFFDEVLLDRLPADGVDLLVTISILDEIHPDLVAAMTQAPGVPVRLARLQETTPILVSGEGSAWLRMHPLARASLGRRFAALPQPRQRELHWRAAEWLHECGDAEAAARHALAAGRNDVAQDWIGRELHGLLFSGRIGEVLGWAERLPAESVALAQSRLALAWAQALCYQFSAAAATLAAIEAADEPRDRYEADLIHAVCALYADDHRRAEALLERWGEGLSVATAQVRQTHVNCISYLFLERGDAARARYLQEQARRLEGRPEHDIATHMGETIVGLTYLREGQPRRAAVVLENQLGRIEAEGGRRSVAACLVAAVLGAALWAQDRGADAESTLAYRLDVIERSAPPQVVALAYLTLARIASAAGDDSRALELLERLRAIGDDRRLPRLALQSMLAQIRLHATARRTHTLAALRLRLETCWRQVPADITPCHRDYFDVLHRLGQAHVALALHDAEAARRALEPAQALATSLNHVPSLLECQLLTVLAAQAGDRNADAILREALSLAETNGYVRAFADAHPAAVERVRAFVEGSGALDPGASAAFIARVIGERSAAAVPKPAVERAAAASPRGAPPALLTAKEAELLDQLAQGMSNKEIARVLDLGAETVKWHLKNVFAKLGAGSRRHAVDRARMLGLI
jgi:LuxR family transcriptional regulator, maltose regulon positive regulatory protein